MNPTNRNFVYLIGIIFLIAFIVVAVFSNEKKNDDYFNFAKLLDQPNYPDTVCIYHEYEVLNVYRMFDGFRLRYGVDYIENDEIKTLVIPNLYDDSSMTVYPSNTTYLVYRERWFVYNNGKKELRDDDLEYKLYLSKNTGIIGTSTHYSRSRESDFHSTVIVSYNTSFDDTWYNDTPYSYVNDTMTPHEFI